MNDNYEQVPSLQASSINWLIGLLTLSSRAVLWSCARTLFPARESKSAFWSNSPESFFPSMWTVLRHSMLIIKSSRSFLILPRESFRDAKARTVINCNSHSNFIDLDFVAILRTANHGLACKERTPLSYFHEENIVRVLGISVFSELLDVVFDPRYEKL